MSGARVPDEDLSSTFASTAQEGLDDANVHVQELKRVFDSCQRNPGDNEGLDQEGLGKLCEQLNLGDHTEYVIGQLAPLPTSRVTFAEFKVRFIQILPEIVEFSSESRQLSPRQASRLSGPKKNSVRNNNEEPVIRAPSENDDTSNDILSDFSDDAVVEIPTAKADDNDNPYDSDAILNSLRQLGLPDTGYLGRYELQLLCQNSSRFREQLSVRAGYINADSLSINRVFDRLDTDSDGKVSVRDLANYFTQPSGATSSPKLTKDISRLIAGPAFSPLKTSVDVPDSNLFDMLESKNGLVKSQDLIDYWESIGVPNAAEVLSRLNGGSSQTLVNLSVVSRNLEQEMAENALSSDLLCTALLAYKAQLEYLRAGVEDYKVRAEHYKQELSTLSQRQGLLIEEMDQSQTNLEAVHEQNIRELEQKLGGELAELKRRYKEEREQCFAQIHEMEEKMHRAQKDETTTQHRANQLERENGRLRREVEDLSQTLGELEGLNSDLRKEMQNQAALIEKFADEPEETADKRTRLSPPPTSSTSALNWRTKAESLTAENKRLRDQVDELIEQRDRRTRKVFGSQKLASLGQRMPRFSILGGSIGTRRVPSFSIEPNESTARFKKELSKLKRRRQLRTVDQDSPEFESEEDAGMYLRPKMRRPLKRRHRAGQSERREQRRQNARGLRLSSDEDSNNVPARSPAKSVEKDSPIGGDLLERRFSADRKLIEHQLKLEMATAEEEFIAEKMELMSGFEREKRGIRDQYEKELTLMMDAAKSQREEALRSQSAELNAQHEIATRDMEIKWASERNQMEREFAEDKMNTMARLQDEFELELRRLRQGGGKSGSGDKKAVEELSKQKKILEDSLVGQRNGYEAKLKAQKSLHDNEMETLRTQREAANWVTPEDLPEKLKATFYRLLEEWEGKQRGKFAQEREDLLQGLQRDREETARTLEAEKDHIMRQNSRRLAELEERLEQEKKRADATVQEVASEKQAFLAKLKVALEEAAQEKDAAVALAKSPLEAEIVDLQNRLSQADAQKSTTEEVAVLQTQLQEATALNAKLGEQKRELGEKLLVLKKSSHDVENDLKNQLEALERKLSAQEADADRRNKELEDRLNMVSEQKDILVHQHSVELVEVEERFKQRLQESKKEIERLVKEQTSSEKHSQNMAQQCEDLAGENQGLKRIIENMNSEGESTVAKLSSDLNSAKSRLETELEEVKAELASTKTGLETSEETNVRLRSDLENASKHAEILKKQLNDMQSEKEDSEAMLKVQVRSLESSLTEQQAKLNKQSTPTATQTECTTVSTSVAVDFDSEDIKFAKKALMNNQSSIGNLHRTAQTLSDKLALVETQFDGRLSSVSEQLKMIHTEKKSNAELKMLNDLNDATARIAELQNRLSSSEEQSKRQRELAEENMRSQLRNLEQQKVLVEEKYAALKDKSCRSCTTLEKKVAELEIALLNTSESGIEDLGSSPEPAAEEIQKLKKDLTLANESILNLRTALAVSTSQQVRKSAANRTPLPPSSSLDSPRTRLIESAIPEEENSDSVLALASANETLKEENFLLNSRLRQRQELLDETVDKYRAQLRETASMGRLLEELCAGGTPIRSTPDYAPLSHQLHELHSTFSKGLD